jgi:hypothetical protein
MRGQFSFPLVAGLAVMLQTIAGCSSDNGQAPLASNSCTTPPCATPHLVSGGIPAIDASALGCFIEPTSHQMLCARLDGCDFLLDNTLFPHCGFALSSGGLDFECVCETGGRAVLQRSTNARSRVCPIVAITTCEDVLNAVLHLGSADMICNAPLATAIGASNCSEASITESDAGSAAN